MGRGGLLKRNRSITQKPFVPKTLKPQNTRKVIRRFHVLLKNKATILNRLSWDEHSYKDYISGEKSYEQGLQQLNPGVFKLDGLSKLELIKALGQIDGEIEKNGGLEVYQTASQQGQSSKRGSDSSKKLMEWLKDGYDLTKDLNALEIGCLSPNNLISTSKVFSSVTRIDLHSQHHLILEQDFMDRPIPTSDSEKFNIISCSLVLNFVPTASGRGDMLKRITKFLKPPSAGMACLFLVLPLPCITNSRYLDNKKLLEVMEMLGFSEKASHLSNKLAYWLFDWNGKIRTKPVKKIELYKGGNRNNFSIVM